MNNNLKEKLYYLSTSLNLLTEICGDEEDLINPIRSLMTVEQGKSFEVDCLELIKEDGFEDWARELLVSDIKLHIAEYLNMKKSLTVV